MVCKAQDFQGTSFGGNGNNSAAANTLRSRLFAAREGELQNGGAQSILPFRRAWEELLATASALPIPASSLQAMGTQERPRQTNLTPGDSSTTDEHGRSRWRPGGIGILTTAITSLSPQQPQRHSSASNVDSSRSGGERVLMTVQSQLDQLRRIRLGTVLANENVEQTRPLDVSTVLADNNGMETDDVPTYHFQTATDQTSPLDAPPDMDQMLPHQTSRLVRVIQNSTAASPRNNQTPLQASETVVISFPQRQRHQPASNGAQQNPTISPRILRLPSSSNGSRSQNNNAVESAADNTGSATTRSFLDMWAETQTSNRRMVLRHAMMPQPSQSQNPDRSAENLDSDMDVDEDDQFTTTTSARVRPFAPDGTSRRSVRLPPRNPPMNDRIMWNPSSSASSGDVGRAPDFRLLRLRDTMNAMRRTNDLHLQEASGDDYSDVPNQSRRRERRSLEQLDRNENSDGTEPVSVLPTRLGSIRDPEVVRRLVRLVVNGDEVAASDAPFPNERPFC